MPVSTRLARSAPPGHVARVRLVPRFGPPPPPRGGRDRIAYYGLGYYMGLVAVGLSALLVWGLFHGWGTLPAHNIWAARDYVRCALYDGAAGFNVLLAWNGAACSLLDMTWGGARSWRGFWINVAVLVACCLLLPAYARSHSVA